MDLSKLLEVLEYAGNNPVMLIRTLVILITTAIVILPIVKAYRNEPFIIPISGSGESDLWDKSDIGVDRIEKIKDTVNNLVVQYDAVRVWVLSAYKMNAITVVYEYRDPLENISVTDTAYETLPIHTDYLETSLRFARSGDIQTLALSNLDDKTLVYDMLSELKHEKVIILENDDLFYMVFTN